MLPWRAEMIGGRSQGTSLFNAEFHLWSFSYNAPLPDPPNSMEVDDVTATSEDETLAPTDAHGAIPGSLRPRHARVWPYPRILMHPLFYLSLPHYPTHSRINWQCSMLSKYYWRVPEPREIQERAAGGTVGVVASVLPRINKLCNSTTSTVVLFMSPQYLAEHPKMMDGLIKVAKDSKLRANCIDEFDLLQFFTKKTVNLIITRK